MTKPTRSFEILELLTRYDVDFIVVGMTAAVLQGAPAVTTNEWAGGMAGETGIEPATFGFGDRRSA